MSTTRAVAHRARQARGIALRAQLAWALTQILLWVSLIGAVGAALLWARRRLTDREAESRRDERHVDDAFATPPEPGKVQQDTN